MRRHIPHSPPPELLSRALGFLCAQPCRELAAFNGALRPYELLRRPVRDEANMTTWLPQWRVPCALQALPDGKTAVCLGGDVFYASEAAALLPGAPRDVVFLANYTEDGDGRGGAVPRLLVFDVARVGSPGEPAAGRYAALREKFARFLPMPSCTVQWVGYLKSAEQILVQKEQYPHAIEGLLCLSEDPHVCVNPLHVCTSRLGVTGARLS